MNDSLASILEGLIEAQVGVILAERVVDQIGNTDAATLDLMLAGRTIARQHFSQKAGAFLGAVRSVAEARVAQHTAPES